MMALTSQLRQSCSKSFLNNVSDRLNDEAKKLISELGSTKVQSLGYRDSWVFVGGKGATVKTNFEKVTTTS